MDEKLKIVVCDDEKPKREALVRSLRRIPAVRNRFDVEPGVENATLLRDVGVLEERRVAARAKSRRRRTPSGTVFDSASILIVDYDLLHIDEGPTGKLKSDHQRTYITGEAIAYLARCYSACGVIVALNQFGDSSFDLTLHDHPDSFADLNIGGSQLTKPALWADVRSGFHPWSWPLLSTAPNDLRRCVEDVRENLKTSILSFFGFSERTIAALPRSISEFLQNKEDGNQAPERTTFADFVTKSENGLRGRDNAVTNEQRALVAASRIRKWLDGLVLPGQDILVDAPHLVTRFPSLLKASGATAATAAPWNATTNRTGLDGLGMHTEGLQPFLFQPGHWLSRPAWWWQDVSACQAFPEVAEPWNTKPVPFVFCEDLSQFVRREAAREFVADLPSPFVRRFVLDPDSAGDEKLIKEVQGVLYRPSIRFAL